VDKHKDHIDSKFLKHNDITENRSLTFRILIDATAIRRSVKKKQWRRIEFWWH